MSSTELRGSRRQGYETPRPEIQALVPATSRSVLDLGCASGALGAALKRDQGARVVGVEIDEDYVRDASAVLDEVVPGDVESAVRKDLGTFDCIVAADVLEHLVDPWTALGLAVEKLEPGGAVVLSVPNVRTVEMILEVVVRGRWPRRAQGLFDATHLRWFTLADVRDLLEGAGLRIERVESSLFYEGWQRRVARVIAGTPLAPFVAGQYLVLARKPA